VLATNITEMIMVKSMSERKQLLEERADAFVVFPGGYGTMDELLETHTLRKLGKWTGDIFVLNYNGFYNPLKALLDHFVETKMLEPKDRELVKFPDTVEQLLEYFK